MTTQAKKYLSRKSNTKNASFGVAFKVQFKINLMVFYGIYYIKWKKEKIFF